ncbi:hypothetical protein ACE1B4_17935 [Aeromonas veronii]|uniref:hypothetical protein n=1 Tax=Aeromonas veronii TaxID=654 RepID=UPI001116998B|nr:hypothetical protein [Aeromonas veronii]TNI05192.1 hypothetical protein CF135_13170 [Aeromonas veronii]HDO1312070.1 hypothetical protein [Aeromonas veronii]
MENYGSEITFDISNKPIKLSVSLRLYEAVKRKFTEDYGLKPIREEWGTEDWEQITMCFDNSLDPSSFLRHLHTMSPEQYEALA